MCMLQDMSRELYLQTQTAVSEVSLGEEVEEGEEEGEGEGGADKWSDVSVDSSDVGEV
jgi:hypothetical protein